MKPYPRRKNTYFQNISFIKNYFSSVGTPTPIYVVAELEQIQKTFLWENSTSKSKHDTLCYYCSHGELKNVDIR